MTRRKDAPEAKQPYEKPLAELTGVDYIRRVKGDALQLVDMVREYGTDALHVLCDAWGNEHLQNVTIALAAAVDDTTPTRRLWAWLDDADCGPYSTTLQTNQVFRRIKSEHELPGDSRGAAGKPRTLTPDARARAAARAHALNTAARERRAAKGLAA